MSARTEPAGREGFTLVETMAALVLAAVIMLALAPPLLNMAAQQRVLQSNAWRDAVIISEANRFTAMPFDQLPQTDACVTVDSGTFPHTRCVNVLIVSPQQRDLTIVVTPLDPALREDSVVVQRARPRENPFI